MVRVRVNRVMMMVMPVMMVLRVIMVVSMIVRMMMVGMVGALKSADARAEIVAERAVRHVRARRARALALDMMVMALLPQPNLRLKAQHLRAIFAQRAVHGVLAVENLRHPLSEGGQHFGMVVQIACLDEFDARMLRRDQIDET